MTATARTLSPGSLVVVTGAAGAAGAAMVQALVATGATVVGAGRQQDRLDAIATVLGAGASHYTGRVVDVLDADAVAAWADDVAAAHPSGSPRVDGVVHLVGGYRGGSRLRDTTPAEAAFLLDQLVRTLQNVSYAFHDHLLASSRSQLVIVSATAAESPTAGTAAYATAKAAAETWMTALADSFRREQAGTVATAAATTLVVKALVDDAMRAAAPDRDFVGLTDVHDLAAATVALWDLDATTANGARQVLAP